ncbi:hypothetical protein HG530_003392 [Fusarium avenaceum]|nr:hypothetical protein HG530_003392 [Fusarium avenaceum]
MSVQVNRTLNRVVEAFDQSNNGTLTRARCANKGSDFTGGDLKAHILHNRNLRSGGVNVLDVRQSNSAFNVLNLLARIAGGIECVGEGLDVGGNVSEIESTNHDSHENSENVRKAGLIVDNHLAALPESQAIVEVQHQHHSRNHTGDGTLDTEAKVLGILEMTVVSSSKALLCAKGYGVSDRADYLIRKTTSLGISFQALFVNQSQLPVLDKADDKGRHKGCDGSKSERSLFGNSILDEVGIGGDAGRNLTGAKFIEEANILAQTAFEIMFANLGGDVLSGVDETTSRDIHHDKLADT